MAPSPLPLDKKPYYNTDAVAESISSDDMFDCYMETVPGMGLITRRRPGLVDFTNLDSGMTAADVDGYLVAATGAGPWSSFAGQPSDIWAHKVTIASTANLSGTHFTLVGTDAEGLALTETALHGPNNGSVSSTYYFKTLSSVTADATLGVNTMNVGWAAARDIAGDGIYFWEPMNMVIVVNNGKIFNVNSAGTYTPLTRLHTTVNSIGHIEDADQEDIILFDRCHAQDNLCHLVTMTSISNLSGLTITITGLDSAGTEQEETLTGPAASATVSSEKYFKSISEVKLNFSPADQDGFVAGATGAGPWTTIANNPPDLYGHLFTITSAFDLSGINFTVVGTYPGTLLTADLLDEDCVDLTGWTDADTGSAAVSEVSPAGQYRFDTNAGAATDSDAAQKITITSPPNETTIEIQVLTDAIGTIANVDYAELSYSTATWTFNAKIASDGLFITKVGAALTEVGINIVVPSTTVAQVFRFEIDKTAGETMARVEVFLNEVSQGSFDCDYMVAGTNGEFKYTQHGHTTDNRLSHVTYFKVATGLGMFQAPLSEVIVGPNADVATGSEYFKTVTSITASSTMGGNTADFGWAIEHWYNGLLSIGYSTEYTVPTQTSSLVAGTPVIFAGGQDSSGSPWLYMCNGGGLVATQDGVYYFYPTDSNVPDSTFVAWINDRFVANDPGTNRFLTTDTNPNTGLIENDYWSATVNPLTCEAKGDTLSSLSTIWSEIYAWGSEGLEVFQDDGVTPFVSVQSAFAEIGIEAVYSLQQADNSIFALCVIDKKRVVIKMQGRSPQVISEPIARIIMDMTTVYDAIGDIISVGGITIYLLSFPTENQSWAYDYKNDTWIPWGYWNSGTSTHNMFLGQHSSFIKTWGKTLTLSRSDAEIYEFDRDVFTDDGIPIVSYRRTGWVDHGNWNRKRSNQLLIKVKTFPTTEFLLSTGWTSTNWTGSFAAGWTHTVGNTTALSQSKAAVIGTVYQVICTVTGRTAGSFTVGLGGATSAAITATSTFNLTAGTAANLTITPGSTFDGTIVISIDAVSLLMFRWRDDGRQTWSNWMYFDLIPINQYDFILNLKRLGMYRSRQYEFRMTDNQDMILVGAIEDIKVLPN